MGQRRRNTKPHFGESERFDQVAHRLRTISWVIILAVLLVAAFTFKTPDHAIQSTVLRAALIYGFVLIVMRLAGKRTLAELSTFDLVVILIISEAIQPALTADDKRMTSSMLLVLTIVGIDAMLGLVMFKSDVAAKVLDDVPTVLVRDGVRNTDAMARERIDDDDIMEEARRQLGLESFEQVRFAILERTGGISVIPFPPGALPKSG